MGKLECCICHVYIRVSCTDSEFLTFLQTLMSVLEHMTASRCVSTQWDPSLVPVIKDLVSGTMTGVASVRNMDPTHLYT